jgi:dTDP-4-dehydrorhamnose 3,5-epimerase
MTVGVPGGVLIRPLVQHKDSRGTLAELFRSAWPEAIETVQWNLVRSSARVLRGFHVHVRHEDYLVVLHGRASVGLKDLRYESPTFAHASMLEFDGEEPAAIKIPVGVAHGFYFHTPAVHLYGVSEYWDTADELGCHWRDRELAIPWPDDTPIISDRDAQLPPLSDLLIQLDAARAAQGLRETPHFA